MTEHYEVRWISYGHHGRHSEGRIGKFASREGAEVRLRQEEAEFAANRERQPLADTSFAVVRVTTDEHGNREEE